MVLGYFFLKLLKFHHQPHDPRETWNYVKTKMDF